MQWFGFWKALSQIQKSLPGRKKKVGGLLEKAIKAKNFKLVMHLKSHLFKDKEKLVHVFFFFYCPTQFIFNCKVKQNKKKTINIPVMNIQRQNDVYILIVFIPGLIMNYCLFKIYW